MKVKSFRGGIHPPAYKEVTSGQAIVSFPSPGKVFLPLLQHTGSPLLPLVKKGDAVKKGQKIADVDAYISAPLHSPIAGKVVSVEEWPHPMWGKFPSIVIENDGSGGEERSVLFSDPDLDKMSIPVLRQWIREGGFVGLGGAAFPTHVKVTPPEGKKIDILILNGAECEPYLTCDHRVMVEKTETVLRGARILRRACEAQKIIIGIEENKPDALEKIRAAIPDMPVPCEVFSLPTQYPQGSEKHLIQTILGKEVPPGGLPLDVGVVVSNVQTAWVIGRKAEEGWPLIER
ncbi:MAG: RnfABCDGE type electron transport complex subunit C, partial [Atribacterota bacterium]